MFCSTVSGKTNTTLQSREEKGKFGSQIRARSILWLNFRPRERTQKKTYNTDLFNFLAKSNSPVWRNQIWMMESKSRSDPNSFWILKIGDPTNLSSSTSFSVFIRVNLVPSKGRSRLWGTRECVPESGRIGTRQCKKSLFWYFVRFYELNQFCLFEGVEFGLRGSDRGRIESLNWMFKYWRPRKFLFWFLVKFLQKSQLGLFEGLDLHFRVHIGVRLKIWWNFQSQRLQKQPTLIYLIQFFQQSQIS